MYVNIVLRTVFLIVINENGLVDLRMVIGSKWDGFDFK